MYEILISIKNRIAQNMTSTPYICGNSDYTVNFDFDEEWDEYEFKTARFITADRTYQDVVFTGNRCQMPVIMDTMFIYVGVYAGNLHTTTPAHIGARKSILSAEGTPSEPTPDVYSQIMEILNQTGKEAIAAAETAKTEADRAKGYADNAKAVINDNTVAAIHDITTAGETAQTSVIETGAQQVANITTTADTAVARVTQEGAKQTAAAKAQAEAAANSASEAAAAAAKAADMIQDNAVLSDKAWSSLNIVDRLCPPFSESGTAITCHPVEDYPLHVVSHIEPVQAGTGDPSPDNVRPISGWDSVNVCRCGKNLLKLSTDNINRNQNGIVGTYTASNDTYTVSGTNTSDAAFILLSGIPYVYPHFKPGEKYVISHNAPEGLYIQITYFNTNGNIAVLVYSDTSQTKFTVPDNFDKINRVQIGVGTSVSAVDATFNIQLELDSEATAYEPYQGDTYTAALPETVYGGTLDWSTGVLTIDWSVITLDGDTLKFTANSTNEYWNLPHNSTPGIGKYTYLDSRLYSSHFYKKLNSNKDYSFLFTTSSGMSDLFSTVDELNAYLVEQYNVGTPVQACYKRETPYAIQLTPQQITALTGQNTIYSNTGDTDVSGRSDPTYEIETLKKAIVAMGGTI